MSAKTDTLAAWRLCGLSALCSGALPGAGEGSGCWRSHEEEICRPAGAGFSCGDGTQRSRTGLLSGGPPGLGQQIGRGRRCRGVSGSNPVLVREFSIPMPIPIPIPTRGTRVCRAGSSSAGGVSVRRLRRIGTVSSYDVLRFLRPSCWDCGQRVSREDAKARRGKGTKTGCHCTPVLGSLRLERSGRENSVVYFTKRGGWTGRSERAARRSAKRRMPSRAGVSMRYWM